MLSGGVGGAKLADGLAQLLSPSDLTIAVNTADDFRHFGLSISPDLDSVTYMLAGLSAPERGWGRADETWSCMETLGQLMAETWFQLGDRDLALHLYRTSLLARGAGLEAATAQIASSLGVKHRIVPMSENRVRTIIESDGVTYSFQDYFVRLKCQPRITEYWFDGADRAKPSRGLIEALQDPNLAGIVIAPSNPVLSIGPMLAIPAIRSAISGARVPVVGVSPIIDGAAVKGPAAKILAELGLGASAEAIAKLYGELLDHFIVHPPDGDGSWDCAAQRHVADILMGSPADRRRVAQICLDVIQKVWT